MYAECGKAVTIIILHLKTCFILIVSSLLLFYSICALAKKHSPFIRAYFFCPYRGDQKELEPPAEQLSSLCCVPVPVVAVVVVSCCTGQGMSLYSLWRLH